MLLSLLSSLLVLRTLMGHKANICSLDFHPYGEFVASGSQDTNIKVRHHSDRQWDWACMSCLGVDFQPVWVHLPCVWHPQPPGGVGVACGNICQTFLLRMPSFTEQFLNPCHFGV